MRYCIILITIFLVIFSEAQTVDFQIDEFELDRFTTWEADISNYEGTYAFGFSEQEWELKLSVDNDFISIQVTTHNWDLDEEGRTTWITHYNTFNKISIKENKAYSSDGTLIIEFKKFINSNNDFNFQGYDKEITGAIFHQYNTGKLLFGIHRPIPDQTNLDTYWHVLSTSELTSLTSQELKIARNTVFARYGHIFKSNGEMDKYFRNQDWYRPRSKDVTKNLTSIEKENIALILAAEKQ